MSINSNIGSVISSDIGGAFHDVPLIALSKTTLRKLSQLLNSRKIFRSEEGYERDWRGLAFLSKQKSLYDDYAISGDDPMLKVIQLWCTNNPKTATVAYLHEFLGIIDRWDVSDDIYENLVEDTKTYQTKIQYFEKNSDDSIDMNECSTFGHGSDPNILTTSDVMRAQKGLPPQMYDAFVLYADADLNYATEILNKLEDNPEYNFKLCMKDRDVLAGVQFEHVALTQLIEERCKHLIVIFTQDFLLSPENKFLVNYAQALQIQHKTRKIVPLLYEDVDIPRTLKIYTHLRYNPDRATLFNFWSKLANSIKNVNTTADVMPLSETFSKNINSNSRASQLLLHSTECQLKNLPSPPTEIPRISIIPPEDIENPKKKLEKETDPNNYPMLRNARSTEQLHSSYRNKCGTSPYGLSTASIGSETKKRKWPSKIFKKFFPRNSTNKVLEA